MNKKSQVEIMGLIVIVILVAVALIFVLQFTISRKAPSIKTYSQAEMAENMLTAMRYTTTECNSLTISELLRKCAAEEPGFCPDGNNYSYFVDNEINFIFQETLEKWNTPYELTAVVPGYYNLTKVPANPSLRCSGERRSAMHLLNTDAGLMTIRLDVCD